MLGQLETKPQIVLKAKGNYCVSPGCSCNVLLKTEKEIINLSQTNITPSLPIHIENIEVLNIDSNTLKMKVTNNNLTPVLITHKEDIAILDYHVHFLSFVFMRRHRFWENAFRPLY